MKKRFLTSLSVLALSFALLAVSAVTAEASRPAEASRSFAVDANGQVDFNVLAFEDFDYCPKTGARFAELHLDSSGVRFARHVSAAERNEVNSLPPVAVFAAFNRVFVGQVTPPHSQWFETARYGFFYSGFLTLDGWHFSPSTNTTTATYAGWLQRGGPALRTGN